MSFVSSVIALLLLIVSLVSPVWLEADNYKQGLWQECWVKNNNETCTKNGSIGWINATASLSLISLVLNFLGAFLTAYALIKLAESKYSLYRFSLYFNIAASTLLSIGLIVFTVCFLKERYDEKRKKISSKWSFSWSYGISWGSLVFQLTAAILLLFDRDGEDIYRKEKDMKTEF